MEIYEVKLKIFFLFISLFFFDIKLSDKDVLKLDEYFTKFLNNVIQIWKDVGDDGILSIKNDIEKLFNRNYSEEIKERKSRNITKALLDLKDSFFIQLNT